MKTLYRSLFAASLLCLASCQSVYYDVWESMGVEKRDILVDRVESARDAQEDAQETFSSALEEFSSVVEFDGGNLEKLYNRLNNEYEDSQDAAEKVSDRIARIDSVANALFSEWEDEIEEYTNPNFKRNSTAQLRETRQRYAKLEQSLRKAEQSMQPVLANMKDNVLYLKHNLNAQAIGALRGEYQTIKREIDTLIANMNAAIDSSDAFIASMKN